MDTTVVRATPTAPSPRTGLALERRGDGRLWAIGPWGEKAVTVRRLFPWSEPASHFSLRDADDEEVALVTDPADLDESSRGVLLGAVREAGFVFDIIRVLDVEEEVELRHWRVETKQGGRVFQTRLDDWPRGLPGGGFLIRDVGGDLYRLEKPSGLDKKSKELLWSFVD